MTLAKLLAAGREHNRIVDNMSMSPVLPDRQKTRKNEEFAGKVTGKGIKRCHVFWLAVIRMAVRVQSRYWAKPAF